MRYKIIRIKGINPFNTKKGLNRKDKGDLKDGWLYTPDKGDHREFGVSGYDVHGHRHIKLNYFDISIQKCKAKRISAKRKAKRKSHQKK